MTMKQTFWMTLVVIGSLLLLLGDSLAVAICGAIAASLGLLLLWAHAAIGRH